MITLQEFFAPFGILSAEEVADLEKNLTPRVLPKGSFFIRQGEQGQDIGFVKQGILRSFYHTSTEEEVTYCFRFQGDTVAAYSSLITQQPTAENIEALTDVHLVTMPYSYLQELEKNIQWLRLTKSLAEAEYVKMEKRLFILQKETAETRYHDLLVRNAEYLQEIPLQYLASYLGITQRHLSRIRKTIMN